MSKQEETQYDLLLQYAEDYRSRKTGFSVDLKTQSKYIKGFVYGGHGTCMIKNYTEALEKFREIKEEYAEKDIIVNQINDPHLDAHAMLKLYNTIM